jgi:hypothetical protein
MRIVTRGTIPEIFVTVPACGLVFTFTNSPLESLRVWAFHTGDRAVGGCGVCMVDEVD